MGPRSIRPAGDMIEISVRNEVVTLVNVYRVRPGEQEALLDYLVKDVQEYFRLFPGFVSVSLHKSLDGTSVVNYAQWRSVDDFESMLRDPRTQTHLQGANEFADTEPHLYEVTYCENGARAPPSGITAGAGQP